ncbi:hypothetical protein H010_16429 [Hydrogenophaga taeniospiralis CCUG 15921]|jgi:hypothetical protein|uniref:Uncharacterized protein n=1 Tax=Hydrogenophaga taeniospiralis CCUG 15921 TaxID=1281780 RepID=A0A9X4NUH3_9BURK|nr:hypothetical protein [Hydrogenophaga taeniospiralis]MDG5976856.1 hypothetical protein [Hydrogenophaga taeniospiralis CCUG 15921]
MRSQVTVSWGEPSIYRFDLEEVQPMPHELARSWLDEQFTFFGCEPIRLTGKVLTADKILGVAQAAGEERFRDPSHRAWALAFARATSAALAKPVVTVDIPTQTLGY